MIVVLMDLVRGEPPKYTRIIAGFTPDKKKVIKRHGPFYADPELTPDQIEEFRLRPEMFDEVA